MWERACVIAVGDEVLTGEVLNTNAAELAQNLLYYGSRIVLQLTVGDDREAIVAALDEAARVADLIILVGGLGPTPDDLTREAVAAWAGVPLAVDPTVAEAIRARHGQTTGREASILQQSQVLTGAEVLPNPVGTAPGQLWVRGGQAVALLPGPPAECRAVAESLWERVARATGRRVVRRTWRCYGLTESEVAHHLRPLLTGWHPRAGLYTRPGVVELRLEAPLTADGNGRVLLERAAGWAQAHLPARLYDDEAVPLRPGPLVAALMARGQSVAAAESLTGGLFTAQLTAVPGASQVVREAVVVYTDDAKRRLGVGVELEVASAVSAFVAERLAVLVRERAGADWGVALTGYAGPTGGTAADPVGTYYCAVVGPPGVRVLRRRTRLGRDGVREAACETARFLLGTGIVGLWETEEGP
jgi:nicotinamide-nucleotide amidase